MVDPYRDHARSVLVAGVARSGTTWVAELLASQARTRIMFEPFHAQVVEGFRQFPYFPYLRPEDENPALVEFTDAVLSGRLRDPGWVDRRVDCLFPSDRVVKDVRVSLFLRWIHDRFPEVPIVFLLRHPCAVVASHLRLGWSVEADLRSMLSQSTLVEDHLLDQRALLGSLHSPLEQVAALWCIQNRIALRQCSGGPISFLFYEDLAREPRAVIPHLFAAVGRDFDASAYVAHARHSDTVAPGSPLLARTDPTRAWTSELSAEQVGRVLEIVEAFDLGHLYDDRGLPKRRAASSIATVIDSVPTVIR